MKKVDGLGELVQGLLGFYMLLGDFGCGGWVVR